MLPRLLCSAYSCRCRTYVSLGGQISIKVVLVIQFCLFRLCDTSAQQAVWIRAFAPHCQRTHKPPRGIYYHRNGRKTTSNISIITNLLTNVQVTFHFPTHISKLVSIFPDLSRFISRHADPRFASLTACPQISTQALRSCYAITHLIPHRSSDICHTKRFGNSKGSIPSLITCLTQISNKQL